VKLDLNFMPRERRVVTHPRPILTCYYDSVRTKESDWSSRGRAATPKGALLASVLRITEGRAKMTIVFGATGNKLYSVQADAGGMSITKYLKGTK
jgi:hypothetical protein